MINIKSLFTFLIVFIPYLVLSQNIKHLSVKEGLPQSFVSALVEDENGFIWIGTRNGLARYDGSKFKIFQSNLNSKDALASNIIEHIQKGNDYSIWIKYETGEIDKFDIRTERCTHIITAQLVEKHKIDIARRTWKVASNGVFWFRDVKGELYSLDLKKKNTLINQSRRNKLKEPALNILEDKDKNIWILTRNYLKKFDEKSNSAKSIPIPQDCSPLKGMSDEFIAFYERANGELMWADKDCLYFYYPAKQVFRKVALNPSSVIKWIERGSDGKEYCIAGRKVLSYSDKLGVKEVMYVPLSGNRQPQAFLVDKSGLIWVGTDAEGVYTVDTGINFESFSYKEDFIVDVIRETYGIKIKSFFDWHDDQGTVNPSYFFRSVWNEDRHWMTLNRTVCYYDKSAKKITKLPILPSPKTTEVTSISGISILKGTPVVIDIDNDIYKYDSINNKWSLFLSIPNFTGAGSKKIKTNYMSADVENDILWITTEAHGLIKIDVNTKEITRIQGSKKTGLPTDNLISVNPDKDSTNILWIGSTAGLIQFNKTTYQSRVFSVKDGLPDNVIYSLLTDSSGNFWMGTNKGLVYFNTNTYKFRVFTYDHGLQNMEFNHYHQLLLPDRKMAFGGITNGVEFYPDNIREDTFTPQTAIVGIKLNNKTIRPLKPELRPVNNLENILLDYDENTIVISYTALQFSQPLDINYRYRLVGYDDDWTEVGNKKEAVYTKLPPGNYTFEVNASNTSSIWSPHIKSLEIQITPPWWKAWWTKLLYLVVGVLSIAWFIRFRINQGVIKNEILLKQKEAKELRKLDQVKTRFFANIAHEFRTPLSLISGPSRQLRGINSENDRNKLLDIIDRNTFNLVNLTDQLLDIAKLEAGVLKPQMVWGDVVKAISNIINAFREEAAAKQVTVKLDAPDTAEFLFSINTFDRILYNLISNALKFCDAGDVITIKVSKNEEGLFLEVKDTGKGIPEEEQQNIFKRYFKASNQDRQQGNGIGLSLVGELVDLHKGTISINSSTQTPSGTKISIYLPLESKDKEFKYDYQEVDESKTDENSNITKPLVLVVEDHEELASFIMDNLKGSYDVLRAKNGEEALNITKERMPDLVLSDVAMEKMGGFEFCNTLKQDININHIPVILLTAKADMDSKLEGLSFGANDYITKPFSISELQLRIKNLFKLQRKQREYYHKMFSSSPEEINITEVRSNLFLEKIYKIIDDNLDDKNFSVDDLASELYMSRTSLHRKVKTMFDIPAGEIIKVYRLKQAAKYLKEGYAISEVVHLTGFSTQSYFSKCFKEYFNVTPGKYLK